MLALILLVSVLSVIFAQAPNPSKPCLPDNRLQNESSCLRRITDAIFNDTEFFFGRNLDSVCDNTAQNNQDDLNCYTDDENTRQYTLASRLFNGRIKPESIDRFLTVKFSTFEGTYNACGSQHAIDTRTTDVNPDMIPAKPVEVRDTPTFDMKVDKDTFYTILILDLGFHYIHGLIVDFPSSKVLIPYIPPLNFRNITNAIVFLVYRQPERDIMIEPRVLGIMKAPQHARDFSVNFFASEHGLVGPVALNWMLLSSDPWAVEQVAQNGNNYCVFYHMDAFRQSPLEFMDKNFSSIDTLMEISFISPPINFSSCCVLQNLGSMPVKLNPVIGQAADLVFLRNQPTVTTEKTVLRSTVNVRLYSIIAVDPDLTDTSLATPSEPYLLWLAINIPEDDLSRLSSASLFPYVEPISQVQTNPRKIYFLLLEQTSILDQPTVLNQTSTSACSSGQIGRCMFDVRGFIHRNQLILRGFNWINVTNDAYSQMKLIQNNGRIEEVCRNVEGYQAGCFGQPAKPRINDISPKQSGSNLMSGVLILSVSVVITCFLQ